MPSDRGWFSELSTVATPGPSVFSGSSTFTLVVSSVITGFSRVVFTTLEPVLQVPETGADLGDSFSFSFSVRRVEF